MQATRPALLLSLALAVPLTTAAQTPSFRAVGYEGTILEVSDAPPGYAVGDRIAGQLLINQHHQSGGMIGPYEATYDARSPAFVSGFWPSSGEAFDRVFIASDVSSEGGEDLIDIVDISDWLVAPGASQESGQQFSLSLKLHGFIRSNKLERLFFDVTSAEVDEPDEELSGIINFRIGMPSFVRFAIDRLVVRPGSCVAP